MTLIIAAILSGVAGGALVMASQMILRKEKFKEIIYREKLSDYRVLAESLWDAYATLIEEVLHEPKDHEKGNSLPGKIGRLSALSAVSLVLSRDTAEQINEFCVQTLLIWEKNMLDELGESENIMRIIEKVADLNINALNALRKDMRADEISDEIKNTFKLSIRHFLSFL